jgi:RNA polymerase sigma-70 factor (ECF subfamily)
VIHTASETVHDEKEEALGRLEKFIRELNELDRALMILYLEEKNQNEIAEIVGITVSNVSTKIGRIKEKLRQQFSIIK